jgi:hypothetical protein
MIVHRRIALVLTALVLVALGAAPATAQRAGVPSPALGTWTGRSVCTIANSPCNSETVVYDITPDTSAKHDPARLVMNADKIVNGAREFMGTLDCYWKAPASLSCPMPDRGLWAFTLHGDTLTGTLVLSDGRLYRRIDVVRQRASPKRDDESVRVLSLAPGVTATIVAPAASKQTTELIFYALPNGNSTAETMGRTLRADSSVGWRYDIQHIAAQTRALRTRGLPGAVVVYLEAEGKSWPSWRAKLGYPAANARIVAMLDTLRHVLGDPPHVTLTGHSGGGSLMFGFLEGQSALPSWLERIAFLDALYNFDAAQHGEKLRAWLRGDPKRMLVSLAYDDREIMLDGKKVVSDSGGTWRATERMLRDFSAHVALTRDTLGSFERNHAPQIELLRHPNPANRILHTEMIGEMNGYMHALLTGRAAYDRGVSVLVPSRAYSEFVRDTVPTP